nr:retrovirus-related Pol polyprotein from transposon TNT 1-94 [Tanacetum cinerariifolium]
MYLTSSRPDIMFATCDKLVCRSSKKQIYVSISTAESEYVAVSGCCAQVLWMRTQLTEYGFFYDKVPIYCDSKSAIAISCNPIQHTRTKHIDVRHHGPSDANAQPFLATQDILLQSLLTKTAQESRANLIFNEISLGHKSYSQNSKAYIILNKHTRKIEESLNVTFDETPLPSKTSPLVDDDLDEEAAIKVAKKKIVENDIEDETLEIDEVKMNDPNITMEEYIRIEEEKAQKRAKVYNWETAKYDKIWYDEDIHNPQTIETNFPAIVFNDELSSEKTLL